MNAITVIPTFGGMVEDPDKAETDDNGEPQPAVQETLLEQQRRFHRKLNKWVGWPILAFVISAAIGTILLGLGQLPDGLAGPLLSFLWWFFGISVAINSIIVSLIAHMPGDKRKGWNEEEQAFVLGRRVQVYLWRIAAIALVVGQFYWLAALMAFNIILNIARNAEVQRLRHGPGDPDINPVYRAIHAVVFSIAKGLIRFLKPVFGPVVRLLMWRGIWDLPLITFVLMLPFWLVYGLFLIPFLLVKAAIDWFGTRRGDRAMVRQLREAGTLAYFVYSEPHQRDHFLGENGVLKPLKDSVLARDWRADLETVRASADDGKAEGSDAMFLRRFRLRKLKDDLPFVAVLAAGGKVRPFYCSGPYRQRRRDGGVALIRVEDDIRSVLEKHVAALRGAG